MCQAPGARPTQMAVEYRHLPQANRDFALPIGIVLPGGARLAMIGICPVEHLAADALASSGRCESQRGQLREDV